MIRTRTSKQWCICITMAVVKPYHFMPQIPVFAPKLCRNLHWTVASTALCPRRLCTLISRGKQLPGVSFCKDQAWRQEAVFSPLLVSIGSSKKWEGILCLLPLTLQDLKRTYASFFTGLHGTIPGTGIRTIKSNPAYNRMYRNTRLFKVHLIQLTAETLSNYQ